MYLLFILHGRSFHIPLKEPEPTMLEHFSPDGLFGSPGIHAL